MKNKNTVGTVLKSYQKYVEMEKKIANPEIHIPDHFEEGRRTFLVLLYIK
jgi:hypothetical protein